MCCPGNTPWMVWFRRPRGVCAPKSHRTVTSRQFLGYHHPQDTTHPSEEACLPVQDLWLEMQVEMQDKEYYQKHKTCGGWESKCIQIQVIFNLRLLSVSCHMLASTTKQKPTVDT